MQDEPKNITTPLIVWVPFHESSTKSPSWRAAGVRARVPGGWLVSVASQEGAVYVPDPGHTWGTEVQP